MGHNKTFDTPNQVKLFKNIMACNVWSLFQVQESTFPFTRHNPTVISQGIPNVLVRFLNGPLYNVGNHIVALKSMPIVTTHFDML